MKANLKIATIATLFGIIITSCNTIKILKDSKNEIVTFKEGYHKFHYIDNQIIVKTQFSDSAQRNFLLDLGAPISVVFIDSSFARLIKNEKKYTSKGGNTSANGVKMKREYIHWGRLETNIFDIENSFLSSMERPDPFACNKLNGIWGANIFSPDFKGKRNKILNIRMQDSTIAVLDKLPEMSNWVKMNVNFTNLSHIKLITAIGYKPESLYFDTGFSGSIILPRKTYEDIQRNGDFLFDKKITYGYIFSYLSGAKIDTAFSCRSKIDLGGIIVIDSSIVFSTNEVAIKAMGMENIKRFNVLVDYKKNELYLQPNPNYQPPKVTFFISKGFKARNMNDNHILVINMEVNGAAEKAGLKVGDQILSINNIEADKGDNCEVIRLFGEIDGKSTQNEVIVNRNNEILKFKL